MYTFDKVSLENFCNCLSHKVRFSNSVSFPISDRLHFWPIWKFVNWESKFDHTSLYVFPTINGSHKNWFNSNQFVYPRPLPFKWNELNIMPLLVNFFMMSLVSSPQEQAYLLVYVFEYFVYVRVDEICVLSTLYLSSLWICVSGEMCVFDYFVYLDFGGFYIFQFFVYLHVGEIRAAADFPDKKQQVEGQLHAALHNVQLSALHCSVLHQCSCNVAAQHTGAKLENGATVNFCFSTFCISLHADATPTRQGESIAFYKLYFSLLLLFN